MHHVFCTVPEEDPVGSKHCAEMKVCLAFHGSLHVLHVL